MLRLFDLRIAMAMVDQPGPDEFIGLRFFPRQFLPVLRSVREVMDLLIVTADQQRWHVYQKLLRTNRAILKLGLGSLAPRIKPCRVRQRVPTIGETIWPKTDKYHALADLADDSDDLSDGRVGRLIASDAQINAVHDGHKPVGGEFLNHAAMGV